MDTPMHCTKADRGKTLVYWDDIRKRQIVRANAQWEEADRDAKHADEIRAQIAHDKAYREANPIEAQRMDAKRNWERAKEKCAKAEHDMDIAKAKYAEAECTMKNAKAKYEETEKTLQNAVDANIL
jgi:chromosome segregation ATPase